MSARRQHPPIPATAEGRAAAACDLLRTGRQTLQAAIAGLDHGNWAHQLSEHADRLLAALPLERFASAPTQAGADELYEALHIVVAVMRGAWMSQSAERVSDQALVALLLAAWHAVDDGQTMLDAAHVPVLPESGPEPAAPEAAGPPSEEAPAAPGVPSTDAQYRTRTVALNAAEQLDALTGMLVREMQASPSDLDLIVRGTLLRMLDLSGVVLSELADDQGREYAAMHKVVLGPHWLQLSREAAR